MVRSLYKQGVLVAIGRKSQNYGVEQWQRLALAPSRSPEFRASVPRIFRGAGKKPKRAENPAELTEHATPQIVGRAIAQAMEELGPQKVAAMTLEEILRHYLEN